MTRNLPEENALAALDSLKTYVETVETLLLQSDVLIAEVLKKPVDDQRLEAFRRAAIHRQGERIMHLGRRTGKAPSVPVVDGKSPLEDQDQPSAAHSPRSP